MPFPQRPSWWGVLLDTRRVPGTLHARASRVCIVWPAFMTAGPDRAVASPASLYGCYVQQLYVV